MRARSVTRVLVCALTALAVCANLIPTHADDRVKDEERLRNSGQVIKEVLDIPDNIPQKLLDKADCVIVMPSVLKAAFLVGGSYGRGAMTCRSGEDFRGPWGPPTMMALEGGSFGFQLGAQATDFVMLVMNDRGARAILNSKVKLGGDASVAAGPLGRDAEADTDATLRAEVLTYSRSRGLFAGISLEGSTLRPDKDANRRIYRKSISAKQIALHHEVPVPSSGRLLVDTLDRRSPKVS